MFEEFQARYFFIYFFMLALKFLSHLQISVALSESKLLFLVQTFVFLIQKMDEKRYTFVSTKTKRNLFHFSRADANIICMLNWYLVCRTSFSSTMNKLVECVDCHRHYHQDCHFPPITDMDLNDPRLVWYCSTCEDNISATSLSVSVTIAIISYYMKEHSKCFLGLGIEPSIKDFFFKLK